MFKLKLLRCYFYDSNRLFSEQLYFLIVSFENRLVLFVCVCELFFSMGNRRLTNLQEFIGGGWVRVR